MKKVKEQGVKVSKIKEILKDLRNALPFAMVNTDPQNETEKLMTYKSVADATASGKNVVINDSSMEFVLPNKIWPNVTSTNINASKVFIVDLDNIDHVWDYEEANKYIKKTSWYQELGPPPIHGFFIVNSAKTAIHWVDRESPTLQTYMTFAGGVDNMFDFTGSEYCNDIFFKDFILYTAHTGGVRVGFIDFLKDEMTKYDETGGQAFYKGNISQRNSSKDFSPPYNSSLAITNSAVNAISVCRDPQRIVDSYGRPTHYWGVATDGNASIYNPKYDAFYDSGASNLKDIFITENGRILYVNDDVSSDSIRSSQNSIDAIKADSFTENAYTITNVGTSWGLAFPSDPTGTSVVKGVSGSYKSGGPIIIGGSNQGAFFVHGPPKTVGYYYRGAFIKMTSTYTSPYMLVGDSTGLVDARIAAYPLNNGDDVGGKGLNLTSPGTVSYTNNGPFGFNCATIGSGPNDFLQATMDTDIGLSEDVTLSLMIKTSVDPNNPANPCFFSLLPDSGLGTLPNSWYFYLAAADGRVVFQIRDNAGNLASLGTAGPDVTDGKWHHIVVVIDREKAKAFGYIDSNLIYDVSTSFTDGFNYVGKPSPKIRLGRNNDQETSSAWVGDIANVSFYKQAWTDLEVKAEYSRMQAALGLGTSQTLASNNVVDVSVDPDSNYAIICAGDTAHLVDTKNGLIYHTETLPNLNCADLITVQGSDLPHMILGGSGSVKQIASDSYIGGVQ